MITRGNISEILALSMCCVGSKGYEHTKNEHKGLLCGDATLKYLIRALGVMSCWYPEQEVVSASKPSYAVFQITAAVQNITIRDVFGVTLYSGFVDISSIVTAINNQSFDYTAQNNNGLLWILNGQNGSVLAVEGAGAANVVQLTASFQGGQEEEVSCKPCLDEQQIENIVEIFKKQCNICLPITN